MSSPAPRRRVTASLRLSAACTVFVLSVILLPDPWELRVLGAWDLASAVYLLWVWWLIWTADLDETREHATWEDSSRPVAGLIIILASVASLVAVVSGLQQAAHSKGVLEAVLIGLSVLTVALSWGTVHTLYALHYAHLYYQSPEGGVDFNEKAPPRYRDFAYLSFTVGMTFQVSDTDIDRRTLRDAVLKHALLSYVFGAVIVAVTINVLGGLIK